MPNDGGGFARPRFFPPVTLLNSENLMKVRMLWAAPGGPLVCGEVYDLADADQFIAAGDAEKAAKGVAALPDPRPQPEPVELADVVEEADAVEASDAPVAPEA
jgi:hypothetical protein